jgi:MATE family multidrug resistance protein
MSSRLSKYQPGSVSEVFAISFPLMLSILTTSIMIFVDRLMLARYSIESMNSVAVAANITSIFIYALVGSTSIAEIFVGQYNGKRNYKKIASPVWQMFWFSVISSVIFIPLAFWGGDFFITKTIYKEAFPFYFWMTLFGPVFGIIAALSSFFIGRGKTKIVTMTAFMANLLNIILDYFLIFGVEGYLDPMGSEGAAISTVTSQIIWAITLIAIFLNKNNREKYYTSNYEINKKDMLACLRVGSPSTISHFVELSGWAVMSSFIADYNPDYLFVHSIGVSIYILFVFYMDGLSKGVAAVTSNAIGSGQKELVKKIVQSAKIIHLIFATIIAIPLVLFPNSLINFYCGSQDISPYLVQHLEYAIIATSLYFLLDGYAWIYAGVLTAAGDTKYIMFANLFSTWVLTVIPCILWLKFLPSTPSTLFISIYPFYAIGMLMFTFYRFRNRKCTGRTLID